MNEIKYLLTNRSSRFSFSAYLKDVTKNISTLDCRYVDFIELNNGGFFFNDSLVIYAPTNSHETYCLHRINEKINLEFGIISRDKFFFACDVFGNQFCFDLPTGKIYFFNIESGDCEFIADDFIKWIQVMKTSIDYYTGRPFIIKWEEVMGQLNDDERLTAKMPFIIGGEYDLENVRVEKFDKILEFCASFAKQIFDLPDKTKVNIKIVP